ncbi:MAG: GlsB/YeaQ/YmgE family stress response membrane protein [Planctomycetaceae bacterium]
MLHFLWMFLIGIVVGAIARLLMPGADQMGILMTGVLGVAGSFVGGALSRLFSKPEPNTPIHPAGILMSIVGALVILFVVNQLQK